MKRALTIFSALLFISFFAKGQSPDLISYQAVVRDNSNNLMASTQVGVQVSILQGEANGSPVYSELHQPTTNESGLMSFEIGSGNSSGSFSSINWSEGPYFIRIETDPDGGNNYTISGTSQLLSVPYALHANTAETLTGEIEEEDPLYSNSEAANITATDITNLSNLTGVNTGDQDLSSYATFTALVDSAARLRNAIPDVSGFLIEETDPLFSASEASKIKAIDITNLSNLSGTNTGDQDLSSYTTFTALADSAAKLRGEIPDVSSFLTEETDPIFSSSEAVSITAADITNLSNLSGVNTGDQDLSPYATFTALGDSTAQLRSEIPDVSSFLTEETDPLYSTSEASNITATDIANLLNLSGTNTGDQDLSPYATLTALGDSAAQLRSELPDVSGFISEETDPVYESSVAAAIGEADTAYWNNKQDTLVAGNGIEISGDTVRLAEDEHYIGEQFGGGTVFHVTPDKKHGLIVTNNTVGSASIHYYIFDNLYFYYQYDDEGKKYTDWRIPSRREANLIYMRRNIVPNIRTDLYFWTRNVGSNDNVLQINLGTNAQRWSLKTAVGYLRPVRSF